MDKYKLRLVEHKYQSMKMKKESGHMTHRGPF